MRTYTSRPSVSALQWLDNQVLSLLSAKKGQGVISISDLLAEGCLHTPEAHEAFGRSVTWYYLNQSLDRLYARNLLHREEVQRGHMKVYRWSISPDEAKPFEPESLIGLGTTANVQPEFLTPLTLNPFDRTRADLKIGQWSNGSMSLVKGNRFLDLLPEEVQALKWHFRMQDLSFLTPKSTPEAAPPMPTLKVPSKLPQPVEQHSKLDASVNWQLPNGAEARFVQRDPSYFITYLSSHTGCNQACRMCHLTQTGQTEMTPCSLEDLRQQAALVINHYLYLLKSGAATPVDYINFNFMARGEPLLNPLIVEQWDQVAAMLRDMADWARVKKFYANISTIMPNKMTRLPGSVESAPTIYYSMYSLDVEFRSRWLPNSLSAHSALAHLKEWQNRTKGEVVLHWALIEGQNDSVEMAEQIGQWVQDFDLQTRFNLVRYNSFNSTRTGVESNADAREAYLNAITPYMTGGSRTIPRVGMDVKASCGMFLAGDTVKPGQFPIHG